MSTEVNKIMKTYQSGTNEKKTKKNFFARYMYPIIFGTALLLVAAAITLGGFAYMGGDLTGTAIGITDD